VKVRTAISGTPRGSAQPRYRSACAHRQSPTSDPPYRPCAWPHTDRPALARQGRLRWRPGRRPYRISRGGRDQRSSRCATGVSKRERPADSVRPKAALQPTTPARILSVSGAPRSWLVVAHRALWSPDRQVSGITFGYLPAHYAALSGMTTLPGCATRSGQVQGVRAAWGFAAAAVVAVRSSWQRAFPGERMAWCCPLTSTCILSGRLMRHTGRCVRHACARSRSACPR
jgi:hypothetical protein